MCNSVHRHVLIHTDIHTDKFGDGSRFSNIKVTRADVLPELSGFLDLRLLPALVIQVFIRLLECEAEAGTSVLSQLCETNV